MKKRVEYVVEVDRTRCSWSTYSCVRTLAEARRLVRSDAELQAHIKTNAPASYLGPRRYRIIKVVTTRTHRLVWKGKP